LLCACAKIHFRFEKIQLFCYFFFSQANAVLKLKDTMELKDQGNRYFAARKYNDAVGCYTKAIMKSPNVPTFFTNRALCYLKLSQWELAASDCRRAIEMDKLLVKGHFFNGQSLLELGAYDEAISSLMRAHELAKEQKLNFGDDICSALRVAKKRRFSAVEEKRIQQEIELQTYLNRLITEEKERQTQAIEEVSGEPSSVAEELESVEQEYQKRIGEVNTLFASIDERRAKRDIPDYLCGKISFDLMHDPVITPSGITYDRKDIEEHLQRVGHFDPVTRTDLTQDSLIPNLAMKDVIDSYLEENPWAEEF
ncbi:unnamed protein product, partial [Owenia fusiformis]